MAMHQKVTLSTLIWTKMETNVLSLQTRGTQITYHISFDMKQLDLGVLSPSVQKSVQLLFMETTAPCNTPNNATKMTANDTAAGNL